MADIFISHPSKDKNIALEISRKIITKGHSVFVDHTGLVAGTEFPEETAKALRSATVVIVLLSSNTNQSSWVREELSSILEMTDSSHVISVLLDKHAKENLVWPLLSNTQTLDFSQNYTDINKVSEIITEIALQRIKKIQGAEIEKLIHKQIEKIKSETTPNHHAVDKNLYTIDIDYRREISGTTFPPKKSKISSIIATSALIFVGNWIGLGVYLLISSKNMNDNYLIISSIISTVSTIVGFWVGSIKNHHPKS